MLASLNKMKTTSCSQKKSFKKLWEALKLELNLTDEDLDVAYKVQVTNGIAVLGWLRRGRVSSSPTYYHHPSSAKKAATNFELKTGLKCKFFVFGSNKEVDLR